MVDVSDDTITFSIIVFFTFYNITSVLFQNCVKELFCMEQKRLNDTGTILFHKFCNIFILRRKMYSRSEPINV